MTAPQPEFGLADVEIPEAARLYWQAFRGKLGRVLGPDDRALAFFCRAIHPRRCLSLRDGGGRLIAICGFRSEEGGFAGGEAADWASIYGPFGAFWRRSLLEALPRQEFEGCFLIEGLCVAPDHQGRGIGTQLLRAAEGRARDEGWPAMQIDVASENDGAIRLYNRLGYQAVAESKAGALRAIFPLAATISMIKTL